MKTADGHGEVLASQALLAPLQLAPEVAPLHVKVENARVLHQHVEWTVSERGRRLAQDLVEDCLVAL